MTTYAQPQAAPGAWLSLADLARASGLRADLVARFIPATPTATGPLYNADYVALAQLVKELTDAGTHQPAVDAVVRDFCHRPGIDIGWSGSKTAKGRSRLMWAFISAAVARELFYSCVKEKTDADAVDRIIDEVSVQVAAIGGSVSQRKQGFTFHTVNMGVKQCGLFRDFSGVPHYSLFEDVDVIDAALAIPASWRLRNRFYQRMFARYLPELDVGEIRAPGRSNDHKPIDDWLRGNTQFADAVCDLIDPDEDTGLPGNYRTFAEAVADIIAGRSTKNDIHAFFRRLTIGSYQRHYE